MAETRLRIETDVDGIHDVASASLQGHWSQVHLTRKFATPRYGRWDPIIFLMHAMII
jgi:hypothetical protein